MLMNVHYNHTYVFFYPVCYVIAAWCIPARSKAEGQPEVLPPPGPAAKLWTQGM